MGQRVGRWAELELVELVVRWWWWAWQQQLPVPPPYSVPSY